MAALGLRADVRVPCAITCAATRGSAANSWAVAVASSWLERAKGNLCCVSARRRRGGGVVEQGERQRRGGSVGGWGGRRCTRSRHGSARAPTILSPVPIRNLIVALVLPISSVPEVLVTALDLKVIAVIIACVAISAALAVPHGTAEARRAAAGGLRANKWPPARRSAGEGADAGEVGEWREQGLETAEKNRGAKRVRR